jgi:hypothetical protein
MSGPTGCERDLGAKAVPPAVGHQRSVPLPCQKQPTMTDNRGHSRDIRTPPELLPRNCQAWGDILIRMRSVVQVHLGPPRSQPSGSRSAAG